MTDYKFWYAWCDKAGVVNEVDTRHTTGYAQHWTAEMWDTVPETVEYYKDTHIWVGVLQGPATGIWRAYTDPEEFIELGRIYGIIPK